MHAAFFDHPFRPYGLTPVEASARGTRMPQFSGRLSAELRRGMTLIEIMVVITVIALMATAISVSVVKLIEKAKVGKAKGDISSLSTALDLYYADQGEYPSQGEGLGVLTQKGDDGVAFIKGGRLPKDPWKQDYVYRYPGTKNPDGFDICSRGKDKQEGSDDDICNGDAG